MKMKNVRYVGVNDHEVDLFEGQYHVPNGMSYNSYVILDEKIAVMDTVDVRFSGEWLANLERELQGRKPEYLIVHHMEPDHSASIPCFLEKYPEAKIVATAKAFDIMRQFFPGSKTETRDVSAESKESFAENRSIVAENGGELNLGSHKLQFHFAPMIHWPEVMMTYEQTEKILFSADAFGKFGALDTEEPWLEEARRYYIGIVGKYGVQVQNILKKAAELDIAVICPLHGPILQENISCYIQKYLTWASYVPESSGVVIAYASIYGYTKEAALYLAEELKKRGTDTVILHDLARDDMAEAVAHAFQYDRLVLACSTYNGGLFPCMQTYINQLTGRGFQNRKLGLMENGSWAPMAAKLMHGMFEKSKNLTFAETTVTIRSALNEESRRQAEALAEEIVPERKHAPGMSFSAEGSNQIRSDR